MSFRDTPITKNCDVVNVMGRRIATSRARKASVGQETVIENWQPFQINGRRVTPCRVYFDDPNVVDPLYMPKINGVGMDEPGATLTGSGDVYLNVKFEFIVNPLYPDGPVDYMIISETDPPNISTTDRGKDLSYTYNIGIDNNSYSMTGSGWYSWKIGSIGSEKRNNLRYFSGVGSIPFNEIDFSKPIYKKDTKYVDEDGIGEWGAVGISVSAFSTFQSAPFPDPYEEPSDVFFRFNEFGSSTFALKNLAGVGEMEPDQNGTLFIAQAVQTIVGV
jgi:hypothetical protein